MRLLDLCCRVGGASMGYHRAGFDTIVGWDLEPINDYPFELIVGDITTITPDYLNGFDAVHISPPCQSQTALTKGTNKGREYPNLIPFARELVAAWGGPAVIENVQGSEIRRDLVLCGEMFNLSVIRHRYFEISGFTATAPAHVSHRGRVAGYRHGDWYDGPYFAVYGDGGGKGTIPQWQQAMGIDWTSDRKNLAEAIPPAYTEHIGLQLLDHLEGVAA
ncbi:DNA cytosine methyltransferase [Microbacterium sp. 1P06AB]|uniref:DNA cytosine methyltransferase n=1 Tax=Microbacterium sp. 1P06AB TaxID=3132289 RepID=UPI0039A726B1